MAGFTSRINETGLIERCDAKEMRAYQHSGFAVDAGVWIEAHDRAAMVS